MLLTSQPSLAHDNKEEEDDDDDEDHHHRHSTKHVEILYRAPHNEAFILDIPTSIAAAQFLTPNLTSNPSSRPHQRSHSQSPTHPLSAPDTHTTPSPPLSQPLPHPAQRTLPHSRPPLCLRLRLRSTAPLRTPHAGSEPKSARARARVVRGETVTGFEADVEAAEWRGVVRQALVGMRAAMGGGEWCFERVLGGEEEVGGRGVKRRWKGDEEEREEEERKDTQVQVTLMGQQLAGSELLDVKRANPALDTGQRLTPISSPWVVSFINPLTQTVRLSSRGPHEALEYRIPPRSAFLQASIPASTLDFLALADRYFATNCTGKQQPLLLPGFDLILLDPPWPNRSVRRARNRSGNHGRGHQDSRQAKGIYATLPPRTMQDLGDLLSGLPIGPGGQRNILAEEGYIAVWLTNKPAARELVLGEEGLFARWGVTLVEEWIWIKVTLHGEPVGRLDGVWRRPWEVLLIGKAGIVGAGSEGRPSAVRRVVAAVPDLHSRKPCLKSLFEDLLLGERRERDRVLEVFARHVVAGWCCWGDEVLRFQELHCWEKGGAGSGDEREEVRAQTCGVPG